MLTYSSKDFSRTHATGGILCLLAAALSFLLYAFFPEIERLRSLTLAVGIGQTLDHLSFGTVSRPPLLWINDIFLGALFFLFGLELKRRIQAAELSGTELLGLPLLGALGSIAGALLIFLGITWQQPESELWLCISGLDMALGLAALALLGNRVPDSLYDFFLTAALFTNIALLLGQTSFALAHAQWQYWLALGVLLFLLLALNQIGVESVSVYLGVGVFLWAILILAGCSGAAGPFCAALSLPLYSRSRNALLLPDVESDAHTSVAYLALPAALLLNAGVPFQTFAPFGIDSLGVILALALGKPLGMLALCRTGAFFRLCSLPPGLEWKELCAIAPLFGCVLSMGLFWGPFSGQNFSPGIRLCLIAVSLLMALVGYIALFQVLAQRRNKMLAHI